MSINIQDTPDQFLDHYKIMDFGRKGKVHVLNTAIESKQRKVISTIQPASATASNVLTSQQVNWRIEDNVNRITEVYLQLKYSVSGGNTVLSNPHNFISSISIYSNNGSTLIHQLLDPTELYFQNHLYTDRQTFERTATIMGTNATYQSTQNTLLDTTVGEYQIKICPNFFNTLKFRSYATQGNLLIRIIFNSAANIFTSGQAFFTTPSVVLRVHGLMESQAQQNHIIANNKIPKHIFFWSVQRHIENLNLTANTTYSIKLSGLSGYCNSLLFFVRPVANLSSPSLCFTSVRMENFEILDSANVSYCGHNSINNTDMTLLYDHNNLFINYNNFHYYSFAQYPAMDRETGGSSGAIWNDSFNILRITTPSTLANGSYQIYVIAHTSETCSLTNGLLVSSRS